MQRLIASAFALAASVRALPRPELSADEVLQMGLEKVVSAEEAAAMALRASPLLRDRAHIYARASAIIPVVVGGPQDTYVPNMITAAVGDVVQFQFSNGNHTVTQSTADAACQPLQASVATAIHSGHIPYQDNQTTVGTFNMPITSLDTMFIYCATGPHCQEGQVMIINPTSSDQLPNYAKLAATAAKNVDGTTVVGGTVASIPLAQAAFVPAPATGGGGGGPPPAAAPVASTSAAADPAASITAVAAPVASTTAAADPAASTTVAADIAASTTAAADPAAVPAASNAAVNVITLPLLPVSAATTLSGTVTTTTTVPAA